MNRAAILAEIRAFGAPRELDPTEFTLSMLVENAQADGETLTKEMARTIVRRNVKAGVVERVGKFPLHDGKTHNVYRWVGSEP